MSIVTSQIGTESNELYSNFANKGNCRKYLGHLYITSSSSHFLNKTEIEQYLFKYKLSGDKNVAQIKTIMNSYSVANVAANKTQIYYF